MKRLVNIRIPVLSACFLAAGISAGGLIFKNNSDVFPIIAVIPITAVIIIFITLFKRNRLIPAVLLCALCLTAGTLGGYFSVSSYSRSQLSEGGVYEISATVHDKGATSSGEYIVIKNITANGERVGGKIIVYLSGNYGDYCETGYTVSYIGKVFKYDAYSYGKLNYNAQENVKYYSVAQGKITAKYKFSPFGYFNAAIRNVLFDNLGSDNAPVAYAMLTGNTQNVDGGAMSSFRYGGVAHIFAVSGLHIGIIYALISLIGKKIKINKYAFTAIKLLIVFLYAGICGFTVSSVRAAIMCAVNAAAKLAHKKYDGANALAISVVIILFISPLSLFSVGLQLSVCAVSGILLLHGKISRIMKRAPRKISGTVATAVSAQAGTMPVMLTNFGYLSGASLLMNILIVPVISVLFALLFLGVLISLILPFAAPYILPYAALPIEFIVSLLVNCGFEKTLLSGFGAGAFAVAYFIGLFLLSDKLNVKLFIRLTAVALTAVFLCTYTLLRIFHPFSGFTVTVAAYYGGGEVLIRSANGNVLIITEGASSSQTRVLLNNCYVTGLDAVIVLGGEQCYSDLQSFDCKDFYVYFGYADIQPFKNALIHFTDDFTVCGINFSFADGYSVKADCGGTSVAVCAGDNIPFKSCGLLISDYTGGCEYNTAVSFESASEKCAYSSGNLTFKVKNGKIN